MKKILLLSFFGVITMHCKSQAIIDRAFHLGALNEIYATDEAYYTSTDADGNIYLTGTFIDSVDFDPGPGEAIRFYDTDGNAAFLAKYSSDMELIFVITAGDNFGEAAGTHFAFDADGNIIWTGWVYAGVDFDPGPATHEVSGSGARDVFLAKYNNDGNYLWAVGFGGYYADKGNTVLIKSDNDIMLTGNFEETVDFDPTANEFDLTATDDADLFFANYSADGAFQNAYQLNADPSQDNFDYSITAVLDQDDNMYICGEFYQQCDFDLQAGVTELNSPNKDLFFAKYNSEMEFVWVKQIEFIDDAGNRELHGITLDAENNIYICGWYEGDFDADPSGNEFIIEHVNESADDIFFGKYANDGSLIWAKAIGGEGFDYARSIAVDPAGNILITGDFYEAVDFDPGAGTAILTAPDYEDTYLALYNSNGAYLNASAQTGSPFSYQRAYYAHAAADGNIYATGIFSETVDFDCTGGDYSLSSNGDYDIFLAKYSGIDFEPVQIFSEEEMQSLQVYPNPASEFIWIDLPVEGKFNLKILNATGQFVYEGAYENPLIDVSFLVNGFYLINIQSEEKLFTEKIIIKHQN